MDSLEDHFWRKPTEIRTYYNMKVLGYLNITCMAFGLIFNIFMILVFTRRNMISPINTIFTHYIVVLTVAGVGYLPRTFHEFFLVELCLIHKHNTHTKEIISYYSYAVAFIFRHIAVWMAMMLAAWRYVAVIHPLKERQYCNMETTKKIIFFGYMFVIISCIPVYFNVTIGPAVKLLDENGCLTKNFTTGKNFTIYEFQVPIEDNVSWYTISVYFYCLLKLLPSLALAIISIKLIGNILEVRKQHTELVISSKRNNSYNSKVQQQIRQKTDRTSKILVVILVLFVVGEVPHGIFAFLTAWYGPKFFWKYYYYAMEIFNTCTIVAEAFNFVIYYAMSRQFRSTFNALFRKNSNNSNIVTPQRSTQTASTVTNS